MLLTFPAGKLTPVMSTGAVPGATPDGSSSLNNLPFEVPMKIVDVAALYAPRVSPIAEISLAAPTAVAIPVIEVQVPEVTVEPDVVLYSALSLA